MGPKKTRLAPAPAGVDVFCLLGMTPQVLTELLAALAHRGRAVHDVTVYTTEGVRGLDEVLTRVGTGELASSGPRLDALFGHMPGARPSGALRCVTFPRLDPRDDEGLRELGRHLDAAVGRAIARASQRPLLACLSGGRKTMSAWLTVSFSLRARAADRLLHVLVPEELEKPALWPPRAEFPGDLAAIELGEVSFPHVAGLVPRHRGPIHRIIAAATKGAERHAKLTIVETESRLEVRRGGELLNFQAKSAVMLAFYAESGGEVAWLELSGTQRARLRSLYELAKAGRRGVRETFRLAEAGLPDRDRQSDVREVSDAHTKLRDALRSHAPDLDLSFSPIDVKQSGRYAVRGVGEHIERELRAPRVPRRSPR